MPPSSPRTASPVRRALAGLTGLALLLGGGGATAVPRASAGPVGDDSSTQSDQAPDAETQGLLLPTLDVVSGRPDMVTGGDALVEVDLPFWQRPEKVRIRAAGHDVTDAFTWDADRRVLVGLVEDLPIGRSPISVRSGLLTWDAVSVTNHPGEGPLLAGPHEEPFTCETDSFTMPVLGGTLGPPLDADCGIEDRVDHVYRTTAQEYAPWPADAASYPTDLAWTTTSTGQEVPFIVRMETGTANRGIYQHAVLHDPLTEPEPTPVDRPAGWNERIVYTLGGGCPGGWYRQGNSTGGVIDAVMLGQGYAVLSSSLNVFGNNCNDLLASETAAMTKEAFIERYGRDRHTIGFGCSGGSYQAHQTADNYPGVFDGILVGCSFPEVGFGTVNAITDARLLKHYFDGTDLDWTEEEKRSVTGFLQLATMDNVYEGATRIDPRAFCEMVPPERRYDPDLNPEGTRCGVYDHMINALGSDPATGFARRPLDNVGIQYGLGALQDGTIDIEQFLDLNEQVGGYDDDANFRPARTVADREAVEAAYRSGRLLNGGQGLATTPIIDYRAYADDLPGGDIHLRFHTFSTRERLRAENGHADNHVSVLEDNRYGGLSTDSPLVRRSLSDLDAWLTALRLGEDRRVTSQQVVHAKPESLVDGCMTREDSPEFVAMPLDRDPGSDCEQWYPSASFPREVAGGSIRADTLVCHTRDPLRTDYPGIDDAEWERLRDVFAEGVCEDSRPGIEQQDPDGTWQRF